METLNILIVLACALVLGFVLVPYLKKKNIIKDEDTFSTIEQILLFARIVLSKNISNEKDREKVTAIINVLNEAFKFAEKIIDSEDIGYKRELTKSFVINRLTELGVSIDFENELLIDIVLEHAIK